MQSKAIFFAFLFILSLQASSAAQRRAHPLYEPADQGFFDGSANLFREAAVTSSKHWSDRVASYAVDGRFENAGDHWAAERIPVWLTVDMGAERLLNAIRLWTFWDGERYYQYRIEGSQFGKSWTPLVDRTMNTAPASAKGDFFAFPEKSVRYVRITFSRNSAGNRSGGHVVEIEGYHVNPAAMQAETIRLKAWERTPAGLHGRFGSIDRRYARNAVPEPEGTTLWQGTAWRGERVSAQLLVWSALDLSQVRIETVPLEAESGRKFPPDAVRVRSVRSVGADRGGIVGDALDDPAEGGRFHLAARTTRPLWISIDVPRDAEPGLYSGKVTVAASGGVSEPFDLTLEVLPLALPAPADWAFHLDLWQNPFSVARYHRVPVWSEAHFDLLEPLLRMLADAGQKCLSTSIIDRPWGGQTFDPFESMIVWTRGADGVFSFDYTVFDRYVEFGTRCGLDDWINCYSMVPWTNRIRYLDGSTGDFAEETVKPGEPLFEEFWRPFLTDFAAHMKEKGWHHRVAIAMDERPLNLMKPTIALVRDAAPDFKIALAGHNLPALKDDIDDWCVFIDPLLDPKIVDERNERGAITTFYVCCGPARPNTFTFSPPAESTWQGLYAAARSYSGFLRWAFNSWVEDPLLDTKHTTWDAGDCFLVYPGPRSSIRFERLREGIQEYEKIRILRELAERSTRDEVKAALGELDAALARFTYETANKEPAATGVNAAKDAIVSLARLVKP